MPISKELLYALCAGLLASVLFLTVFGMGLGFLFMFLPTLPMLAVGMSPAHARTYVTLASSSLLLLLIVGVSPTLFFTGMLGLPAWYLTSQSLRFRSKGGTREFLPLGGIFLRLSLAAATFIALITAYYSSVEGGLPATLSHSIEEGLSELQGEYGEMIDLLANQWSFLIFPVVAWLWSLSLFAHSWIAHTFLKRKQLALRDTFALEPFTLPTWLLSLLAICALASLIGSTQMAFAGKAILITLLLPYFFSGAAMMHRQTANWSNQRFFLFFIYFLILTQFWPALGIALYGLYLQLATMVKPTPTP